MVVGSRLNNRLREPFEVAVGVNADHHLQRVGEIPLYNSDAIVRRAPALQRTRLSATPVAAMNAQQLTSLGIEDGAMVLVKQGSVSLRLTARRDDHVPTGCVRLPGAMAETAVLGDLYGEISVERA
jgi:NADH-quinone oxidoreductase subunit G